MTLTSPRPQPRSAAYAISVTIGWHAAQLRLRGDIDLAAAEELTCTLDRLDRMPAMTVHVDMSDVTFLDSSGTRPIVEAARRRRDYDRPPLLIESLSRPARRLLTAAGLGGGPNLDIDSWDLLTTKG